MTFTRLNSSESVPKTRSPEAQEAVLQDLMALVCPWLYLFRCSPAVLSVLSVRAVEMGISKELELNPTEAFQSRQVGPRQSCSGMAGRN